MSDWVYQLSQMFTVFLKQVITCRCVTLGQDMIFRFGGEEFVFVLSNSSQEGCSLALERFRETVASKHFPQVGQVTVSLGACRMSREIYTATLMDYADKAMYHSKKNGRNQLTF